MAATRTALSPATSILHDRAQHGDSRDSQAKRIGIPGSTLKRIEDEHEAGRPIGLSRTTAQLLAIRLDLPAATFLHCCKRTGWGSKTKQSYQQTSPS